VVDYGRIFKVANICKLVTDIFSVIVSYASSCIFKTYRYLTGWRYSVV